jgi:hypothetical protein
MHALNGNTTTKLSEQFKSYSRDISDIAALLGPEVITRLSDARTKNKRQHTLLQLPA